MTTEPDHDDTLRELPTDRGTLRYHVAGEGEPLLLLHGSGPGVSGWRNFRGNFARFAQHFRTYILEFPGFGVSDDFGAHPMATAVDAVGLFLDGLGIERAAIVGNSMGGAVACQYAIAQPDRVRRLVTIGGIGRPVLGTAPSEGIELLMDFTDDPTRERLITWLHSMVYDRSLITDELVEERWRQATEPATLESARRMYSRAALAATMRTARGSDSAPYWAQFDRIEAPTLVTWGRDDRVSPLDMALLPMRDLPNGELHVFPKCGHWAMIEQKDAFENAVLAFLTRADRGSR